MFHLFRRLNRWYKRYFRTSEFRPRADDSVISVLDQNSNIITCFTYQDLGSHVTIQLNEHGRLSSRRCHYLVCHVHYSSFKEHIVTKHEYRCRILSSRPIDVMKIR